MLSDLLVAGITLLVFGAVAILVFVFGQIAAVQFRVRRRFAVPAQNAQVSPKLASSLAAIISTYFDEKRFGIPPFSLLARSPSPETWTTWAACVSSWVTRWIACSCIVRSEWPGPMTP